MNKAELIEEVVKKTELSKKSATEALEAIIEAITSALKKGDTVTLVGFGTFKVKHRKSRQGINPKTGESIKIPAKKVPVFVAGSALKEKIK